MGGLSVQAADRAPSDAASRAARGFGKWAALTITASGLAGLPRLGRQIQPQRCCFGIRRVDCQQAASAFLTVSVSSNLTP
jgi:hypothetical protein